jgi:hypothetical protein
MKAIAPRVELAAIGHRSAESCMHNLQVAPPRRVPYRAHIRVGAKSQCFAQFRTPRHPSAGDVHALWQAYERVRHESVLGIRVPEPAVVRLVRAHAVHASVARQDQRVACLRVGDADAAQPRGIVCT